MATIQSLVFAWALYLTNGTLKHLLGLNTALYAVACLIPAIAGAWLVSFAYNYIWSAPQKIHQEQEERTRDRNAEIAGLNQALADAIRLTPQELTNERNRRYVKSHIANATPEELKVLRDLGNHVEIYSEVLHSLHPRLVLNSCTSKWLNTLIIIRTEVGSNHTFWAIRPRIKDALVDLLYGEPEQ